MTISPRSIVSLLTGKFWAASLDKMNDPFEDRFKGSENRFLTDNCGVFCASKFEEVEGNILTNPLMWAHYTDNHTGIAIGLKTLSFAPNPSQIIYMSENEIENQFKSLLDSHKINKDIAITPLAEILFKYKPIYWKYENEYRQVHLRAANTYIDPNAEINEVVFGFRSKEEDELAVWSVLRNTIKYKKAINRNGRIEIDDYIPPMELNVKKYLQLNLDMTGVTHDKISRINSF